MKGFGLSRPDANLIPSVRLTEWRHSLRPNLPGGQRERLQAMQLDLQGELSLDQMPKLVGRVGRAHSTIQA